MVLMLTHFVHSAHSGDLKCTEDNKLLQISAARELLELGSSLGYKFNSSLRDGTFTERSTVSITDIQLLT